MTANDASAFARAMDYALAAIAHFYGREHELSPAPDAEHQDQKETPDDQTQP